MANQLLRSLFDDLQQKLAVDLRSGRHSGHPGSQGRVSEVGWQTLLSDYLPNRYRVRSAFVVDSKGERSEEIDLVIHDQQYTPLLFERGDATYVPAESVYAVFEVKQTWSARHFRYAAKKVASVRRLLRTSAQIPHAGGVEPPRQPFEILGGVLASRSRWNPPLRDPFREALNGCRDLGRLHLGCALESGAFSARYLDQDQSEVTTSSSETALVFFFLALLEQLQELGTAPAIDYRAYRKAIDT